MKNFPTDPMRQHDRFIEALCQDWRESGVISLNSEHTPRANAVAEISRQINRGTVRANNAPVENK